MSIVQEARKDISVMSREEVGIVAKPNSSIVEETLVKVVRSLTVHGIEVKLEENTAKNYELSEAYEVFRLGIDHPKKLIVVGGDGTLLRTVMSINDSETIVMGIRAGKRGFLLDVEQYEVEDRIRDFITGNFRIVEYPRLLTYLADTPLSCVLNDVVLLTKMAKMVKLAVYVDGERVMGIDGDGIIISTTVGSTAYSLSAGGPIIDPRLNVIVLTPLNPVQLHLRPIVLPSHSVVEVEVAPGSNNLYLSLDGQEIREIDVGDIVTVKKCDNPVKIARFKWWENYYERLYTRLLSYW